VEERGVEMSQVRMLRAAFGLALVLVLLGPLQLNGPVPIARAATYDWLQYNGDAQHSGDNNRETAISAANVGSLQRRFRVTLPSVADGAPGYLSGVSTPGGVQDLLFLTTKDGHILALNAHTGATAWSKQYGPGSCRINNGGVPATPPPPPPLTRTGSTSTAMDWTGTCTGTGWAMAQR
jgi:hypothetical protein